MSYLVLARKWRPKTFKEVVGQAHVTKTLQNALVADRLTHALLFSGPRGVGKTSVARILAKAVNCEADLAQRPCNQCRPCGEIAKGAAIDVQEIDGASNRGIDEIRQLRENILFHPTSLRYKVCIVDEVHMLTKEAFNALLKTLEEPPSHVYFIFATTEPHKVPDTIQSRCQHYEFRRLSTQDLASHLDMIVKKEGLGLDRNATTLLAKEAEGSVRDSLSLLDQVTAYGAKTYDEVCQALGVIGFQLLERLALAILRKDVTSALEVVHKVYSFGGDVVKFTADFVSYMRDLTLLRSIGPSKATPLIDLGQEELVRLYEEVAEFPPHHFLLIMENLLEGQESLARSSTPRLSLEILLMRLCLLAETLGVDSLLERLNELISSDRAIDIGQGRPSNSPEASAPPEARRPPYKPPGTEKVVPEEKRAGDKGHSTLDKPSGLTNKSGSTKRASGHSHSWDDFLSFLTGQNPIIASLIDCEKVELDCQKGECKLVCKTEMQQELLKDREKQQTLHVLAKEFWGKPMRFTIESPGSFGNNGNDVVEKARDQRQEMRDAPLVKEAMKVFGARISEIQLFKKK